MNQNYQTCTHPDGTRHVLTTITFYHVAEQCVHRETQIFEEESFRLVVNWAERRRST